MQANLGQGYQLCYSRGPYRPCRGDRGFRLLAVSHGGVGEPVDPMGFGNQVLPDNAGVFMGPGPLIPQPLDGEQALPLARSV
jgi:hypothetical protein